MTPTHSLYPIGLRAGHVKIKALVREDPVLDKSRYLVEYLCCSESEPAIISHGRIYDLLMAKEITRCASCALRHAFAQRRARAIAAGEYVPLVRPQPVLPFRADVGAAWPIPPSLRPGAAGVARP
jgi:hypothetical protein